MKLLLIILISATFVIAGVFSVDYLWKTQQQAVDGRAETKFSGHKHGEEFEKHFGKGTGKPALDPQQALAAFRIAPDFQIELVAAEPLVVDPVAMAWDESGHLYVVEMRGFMRNLEGEGEDDPVGQVVVLFDDNKDGTMDRNIVFADKLVNPRAIAIVKDGILIGEPPNLLFCPDSDRDFQCDEKIRIGAYANNRGGNVEHSENALYYGLDNWLYNAKSDRKLQFKNGKLVEKPTLFRGQWGITQDNLGRLYYNNSINLITADFYPAEHVYDRFAGTIPAGLGISLTDEDELHSVRETPGVNRGYVEGVLREDRRLRKPTAASGLLAYRGGQLPEIYDGDVFVTEPAANVIAHFKIESNGLELEAKHQLYEDPEWRRREFLASTDERFRPVDIKTGPDGALYVIDMYRGLIQYKVYLTDYLRKYVLQQELEQPLGMGRIYRIVHKDGGDMESVPQLANLSGEQLAYALTGKSSWQRDTAQRLLVAGQYDGAVDTLRNILHDASGPGVIHALWTLKGLNALAREDVLPVLQSDDYSSVVQALRAGHEVLQVDDVLGLLDSEKQEDILRQQIIFNLSRWPESRQVQRTLIALLDSHIANPYLNQAILATVKELEMTFLSLLLAEEAWQNESGERAAFLVSLARSAYLSARGDLRAGELQTGHIEQLLDLIIQSVNIQIWQQKALLEGIASSVTYRNFEPVMMAVKPKFFTDSKLRAALPQIVDAAGRAFTWPDDVRIDGVPPLTEEQEAMMAKGEEFYGICANCHGREGAGVAGLAPSLVNSPWVTGPPEWLGRMILQGITGPIEVDGEVWEKTMPGHAQQLELDNEMLAGLMIYIRRSWGNTGSPVDLELVEEIRRATVDRHAPWTVAELESIPFTSPYSAYTGTYKVDFMDMALSDRGGKLFAKPSWGEPMAMRHVYQQLYSGSTSRGEVTLDFMLDDAGNVSGVTMVMGENKVFLPKVDESKNSE